MRSPPEGRQQQLDASLTNAVPALSTDNEPFRNILVDAWLTVELARQEAQQVVAGLLQQNVVVSFICAVRVIIITQITQTTHWQGESRAS